MKHERPVYLFIYFTEGISIETFALTENLCGEGSGNCLCLLHLCLHIDLLPEDPPRHEGPRHPQPDGEDGVQPDGLDAGQARNQPARRFLLRGVHL